MDFSDERYVRLYVRDTATWELLEWEGRTTFMHLLRKVSRAGVFDFGVQGAVPSVAAVCKLPEWIVEAGLTRMVTQQCCIVSERCLVLVKFIEAQEAPMSSRLRQEESRARRADHRDRAIREGGGDVTKRDKNLSSQDPPEPGSTTGTTAQRPVTKRDNYPHLNNSPGLSEPYPPVESQNVTNQQKMSRSVTPSQTEPNRTVQILPVSSIQDSQTLPRVDGAPGLAGSDSAQNLSSSLPIRPVRRVDPMVDKKVHVTAWKPVAEAEGYAVALGLSARDYETTLVELRSKVRPETAYPNFFDDRLCAFLESAGRRLVDRARGVGRPGAPAPGPRPPMDLNRLSPEERAMYQEFLSADGGRT